MENELIRQARTTAGLTQAQLAEMVGTEQSFVSQWELGKRPVPDNYLAAMPAEIRIPIVRARIAELEKLL